MLNRMGLGPRDHKVNMFGGRKALDPKQEIGARAILAILHKLAHRFRRVREDVQGGANTSENKHNEDGKGFGPRNRLHGARKRDKGTNGERRRKPQRYEERATAEGGKPAATTAKGRHTAMLASRPSR